MEFNKKVQIALGEMFKDVKLDKVATPKKVELSKIDDLLMWSKGGDTDAFDELAKLVTTAQKLENSAYNKLQKVEEKEKEAAKLRQMAKELGAERLLNDLDNADKLLANKKKNIRAVIKLLQRATQDNI